MWNQLKPRRENIILAFEYDDFAYLEVERVNKNSVSFYTININIVNGIFDTSLVLYKMSDVTAALNYIKERVEFLDKNYEELSNDEYNKFFDDFERKLNEF